MAQRLVTETLVTSRPGAYVQTKVLSTTTGAAVSGIIVLVGEADAGPATLGVDATEGVVLKDTFYTPDQLDKVIEQYKAGPIVEAFRAIASASADTEIVGSANRIYIAKTNKGTKASATIDTAYGTMKAKNWGTSGNKLYFQVTQSKAETPAEQVGGTISAFGASLDNVTFDIRENGGAATTITLGSGAGVHDNLTQLLTELNSLLPATLEAVANAANDGVIIRFKADPNAHTLGYGKALEFIETNPGDLAKLALVEGLFVSAQEPEVQVDIKRFEDNINEQFTAAADVALKIGYQGTTATVTITSTQLTTNVVGGAGANLSLKFEDFSTLQDLAAFIDGQTGYSASVESKYAQQPPTILDQVSGAGICANGANLEPGRIKVAVNNFKKALSGSAVVEVDVTATVGLPDAMTVAKYLTGGARGATSGADIINALTDAEAIDANFIVPLFSRDATDDIAEGLTDSASTYTIDAIHTAVKNHVLAMSAIKIKKPRQAFLSFWGTWDEVKKKAGQLAHYRLALVFQKTTQVDVKGNTKSFYPWHTAAIAAGMQAAGIYKNLTGKFANVVSFTDPSGFDSNIPGQVEEAIESGVLFLEKVPAGNRWVVDQTTYGVDENFVYNSITNVYLADLVAIDLFKSLDRAFVGKSLADLDASSAVAFIASKMEQYKRQKFLAASDDAPLGYKNINVKINGPVMEVSVEIKLATALLFIPITVLVSQVQSSATA